MANRGTLEYARQYYESFATISRAQSVVVPHLQTNRTIARLDDHQTEAMDNIAETVERTIAREQQAMRFLVTHCCGSGKTWVQTNLAIASASARREIDSVDG